VDIPFLIAEVAGLLLLSAMAQPLARLLRLPFSLVLVMIGYVAVLIFLLFVEDTGLRARSYHDLVFYVLLPILIFESAFRIDSQLLLRNLPAILLLAILGMLLSALISAVGIYYGIGHPAGFPWLAALITGSLLAATDPVAVVAQMRSLGAPKRLEILMEGESLFNDATAVVLFGVCIAVATAASGHEQGTGGLVLHGVLEFIKVFSGGILVGLLLGLVVLALSRWSSGGLNFSLLSIAGAYGAYLLAEHWHLSGVMAVLCAGLLLGSHVQRHQGVSKDRHDPVVLWETLGHFGNALIFLLSGMVITLNMFSERWRAILIALLVVFVARAISTTSSLAIARSMGAAPFPPGYRPLMVWGGLRGAVTLALALSLPVELSYWWTIQAIAFGVVLFTLFVQAPLTPWLMFRLGMVAGPDQDAAGTRQAR